jgi:hypothetical protein
MANSELVREWSLEVTVANGGVEALSDSKKGTRPEVASEEPGEKKDSVNFTCFTSVSVLAK